jgi:PEP-CTERM motif
MRKSLVAFHLAALAVFTCCAMDAKAAMLPPVVVASDPDNTFTISGPAVLVDPGISVYSSDFDITGATEQIENFQTGDSLHYTPIFGVGGSYNAGDGLLSLSGSASPAQYQAALETVTFSTTSAVVGTRDIGVVAYDSAATPTNSNTATDLVNVVATPEPASVVMMALGAIGLLGFRRLRSRQAW